jgi:hypothetical protein
VPCAGQSASPAHATRWQTADTASQAKSGGQPDAHALGPQWCVGEHASPSPQSASLAHPGTQVMPNERSQLICSHTSAPVAPAQSESAWHGVVPGSGGWTMHPRPAGGKQIEALPQSSVERQQPACPSAQSFLP